jgi:small subunit ribosomal protein S8e
MGRPPSLTKIGPKRVRLVRCRGGNLKCRALRLDHGSFTWGSESISRKTRVLGVVYNASNNELVRTNTLVKGAIVQIDAAPLRQWYQQHYGMDLGKKSGPERSDATASQRVQDKHTARLAKAPLDNALLEQFKIGRLYASISSRPGQTGRVDGYILEGKELDFYVKKLKAQRGK